MHVALLAGGVSGERDVSLNGAEQVAENLDREKYEVTLYDTATDLRKLSADAEEIDVALIILHGVYGEDGTVQGYLDLLGIPYQGAGVLGSSIAMDKDLSKFLYQQHGLQVAPWVVVDSIGELSGADHLNYPLVVKPVRVGSSLGLTIVREKQQLVSAVEKGLNHDTSVMIEEYVCGREITVGVLGNSKVEPLPVIEIIPGDDYEFFDYEAKYKEGASREVCPAQIPEEIKELAQKFAVKAHHALRLENYSRTDMILDENGRIFLLETNTIPGMTKTSLFPQAANVHGLEYGELLDRLIELAIEKKKIDKKG